MASLLKRVLVFASRATILLSSGVVGSLCMMAIGSGRLPWMPPATAGKLLGYIPWELLGVTVAKFGADTVIFATVSTDRGLRFVPNRTQIRNIGGLALLVAAIGARTFGLLPAAAMWVAIWSDVVAVCHSSELMARREFNRCALLSFLRYPTFFGAIFALRISNFEWITFAFAISSVARAAVTIVDGRSSSEDSRFSVSLDLELGIQQFLNYVMLKLDQLLLPALVVLSLSRGDQTHSYAQFQFLTRVPELIAGLATSLGGLYLSHLVIEEDGERRRSAIFRYVAVFASTALTVALLIPTYVRLKSGDMSGGLTHLPFILQSGLVIPVYASVYSMFRKGAIRSVIRFSALSIFVAVCGTMLIWLTVGDRQLQALFWLTPIEMTIFLLLTAALPWGPRRPMIRSALSPQPQGELMQ